MLWSHVHPIMALKGDKSSTIENYTFWVTGPAWMGNMTFPKEVVDAPLNPYNICLGFFRVDGERPIFLYADICKRSAKLPESIKTLLASKSLIPSVRIRASSCGCNTQLGFIGGKVIIPSIGQVPPTCQVVLDGVNLLSYGGYSKQSLFVFPRIVFLVNRALVDVVSHNSRDYCG